MKTVDSIESLWWQPELGKFGSVVEDIEDIAQCIKIILTTRKGQDPHRPEFGSDIWKYIDYPVNEAIPNIIREVINAINTWEPRCQIKRIQASVELSQVFLRIEWTLKGLEEINTVEVIV